MLQIKVDDREFYDEVNNLFVTVNGGTLQLEHSLVSLSKWESKWCKPFLTKDNKTREETLDYIRCMTINNHVDPNIYLALTNKNIKEITDYIEHPMSATTIKENKNAKGGRRIVTSEVIYYWMVSLNIPFECQKWHLNRLLKLIQVCNAENAPASKLSKKQTARDYAAINAARRKKFNSKG